MFNAQTNHDQLVNHASEGNPNMPRVTPGDTLQSYLIHKLRGSHVEAGGAGERMPNGGPYLSEAEIARFEAWVNGGDLGACLP